VSNGKEKEGKEKREEKKRQRRTSTTGVDDTLGDALVY
jgi:hypothetical protein